MAAALPQLPIRAIYLGGRSFITEFARAHLAWCRCARIASATALPEGSRGPQAPQGVYFFTPKNQRIKQIKLKKEIQKGPSRNPAIVAGVTHFVAAALPKSPIRAIRLGDRSS